MIKQTWLSLGVGLKGRILDLQVLGGRSKFTYLHALKFLYNVCISILKS